MFLDIQRFQTVWLNLLLILDSLFDEILLPLFSSWLGISFIACVLFVALSVVVRKFLRVVLNN